MQKGNTVFLLRDIALNPADPASTPLPRYVGLASDFNLLALNLRWDTRVMNGMGLRLSGHYVLNLSYDEGMIGSRSAGPVVNNLRTDGQIVYDGTSWKLADSLGLVV